MGERVALVTGGGTGIGRATVLELARRGVNVVVNYSRSREAAEETCKLAEELGVRAMAVQADVSDESQVRAMVERIEDAFGRLDYLVNNGATTVFVKHADLDGLKDEDWNRILAVNVKGPFFCARRCAHLLRQHQHGAIVNVSSASSFNGKGSSIAYAASKGALNTLTYSLARVFAPEVRVNAVAPGAVLTDWYGSRDHEQLRQRLSIAPLRRVAEPEDVAAVIVALLLDFRHITGQVIPVEGGTWLV